MKTLPLLLTASLLLTACSKTVKEVHETPQNKQDNSEALTSSKDVELLQRLLGEKNPNLALAELLVRSVSKENQSSFKQLLLDMDPEATKYLIKSVQENSLAIRNQYLYRGKDYGNDVKFYSNVVGNEYAANVPTATEQLQMSVFSYIQHQALDNIVGIYQKNAEELSKDISMAIIVNIADKNPALIATLEAARGNKEKILDILKNSATIQIEIDKIFDVKQLPESDQYRILAFSLVAGGIYTHMSYTKDFEHLVREARKVMADAKRFQEKVNEINVLTRALGTHLNNTVKNTKEFKEGFTALSNDIKREWQKHSRTPKAPDSKIVLNAIYETINAGPRTKQPNFAALPSDLKINLDRTVSAAGNIVNNLSSIVSTTESLLKMFKVSEKNDISKALRKADKVLTYLNDAKTIAAGFTAGGYGGAAAALTQCSFMKGEDKTAKLLSEINKKLDIVIENQQKMMRLQLETMNMVKELAIMVDKYHQEEMMALAELRDSTYVVAEISKIKLNQDLASCEVMIKDRLKGDGVSFSQEAVLMESIKNIRNLSQNKNIFDSSFKEFKNFVALQSSDRELTYNDCQAALSQVFNGRDIKENPVRRIFTSDLENNLVKFQDKTYAPMLKAFYTFNKGGADKVPLHLPASDMKNFNKKIHFLKNSFEINETTSLYEIDELISTRSLERYVTSLLILHPILELDRRDWGSLEDVVHSYSSYKSSRSLTKLENALYLTQSAIAQETILAGEPILHEAYKYADKILSSSNCSEIQDVPFNICLIRANKLFMKNLMMYTLTKEIELGRLTSYRYGIAYESKDLKEIAKSFNPFSNEVNFVIPENEKEIYMVLGSNSDIKVRIPTPESLDEGKILYSEDLLRLNLMQAHILEALEKVAPLNRLETSSELLNLILLQTPAI